MTKTNLNLLAVRALLTGWAKWKKGEYDKNGYLSPPNLIYRLMTGDIGRGSAVGSIEPVSLPGSGKHNALYHRLDCVIDSLPKQRKAVIGYEFLRDGLQKDKARDMQISLKWYMNNLNLALNQILKDEFVQKIVSTT